MYILSTSPTRWNGVPIVVKLSGITRDSFSWKLIFMRRKSVTLLSSLGFLSTRFGKSEELRRSASGLTSRYR